MTRLEQIRERWEKATPGPWKAAEQTHGEWIGIHDNYSALGTVFGPSDADAIAHAREDVPWMLAELQRLNHGRLCRKHYENGPDNEIHAPAGCIICVINRAEKAEAERDQARQALDLLIPENNNNYQERCKAEAERNAAQEELAELRAEKADACTQLGCQAIDRTNEAEAHAHKLEEAIRRAVLLANDSIVRMRAGNRRVEAETGQPSTMRPFVFVDELIDAMRPGIPNDQPVEHISGERRDCAACQREADAEDPTPGGEG